MHGRMARYSFTGDAHEIAREAEDGMLPVFQAQPGFKSYSLVVSDDELLSFSAWDTPESAEAANTAAADWIAANIAGSDRAQGDECRRDRPRHRARREHQGGRLGLTPEVRRGAP